MDVAVTGGTGVVGSAVLRHLVEAGHNVRAMIRASQTPEHWDDWGVEASPGDMTDANSLRSLVDGCSVVFNVAGVNEMCVSDTSAMDAVNVDGVRNLMTACREAEVDKLVHTSSAVTLGERHGEVGDERSPHRGSFLSEYERTKYLGERALFAECGDLAVVSVNPSSVQGPGRSTGTARIILEVVNHRLPFLIDSTISLVDIDDCAAGHLLAAERGVAGERYVLSGPVLTVRDAVEKAAAAVGEPIRVRFLPVRVVTGLVGVLEPLARSMGKALPVCREMVRVMAFGHTYDGGKAASDLGLQYRSAQETIKRTVDWFESQGLLTN